MIIQSITVVELKMFSQDKTVLEGASDIDQLAGASMSTTNSQEYQKFETEKTKELRLLPRMER